MKKTVALIAALLSCCLAYSQEANYSDGSHAELVIVPRLDADCLIPDGGKASVDLGMSSLYTFFDGELGQNLSFSISNHWLSAEPGSLYRNTFHSSECNWVDWANVTASLGNFYVTVGKDIMAVAMFELEPNDVDSHYQLNSGLWNTFQVYQWGASAGWTSNDEATTAGFQFSTSPFGAKFFSGHYAYTLFGQHDFDAASFKASATLMPGDGRLYAIGSKFNMADFTLGIDAFYCTDLMKGVMASYNQDISDNLELTVKAGYDTSIGLTGGAVLYWFPMADSKDLRFHAMASYGNWYALNASIGLTYFLNITVF